MSDRFLNTSGTGNTDLTNGTVNAFLSSLTVSSLSPSLPLKTNSVNTLISTRLDIRDINTLESRLDSISGGMVSNPNIGTLVSTDFETSDYFSLNTEIQKTDNLLASTQTPNITNISGLTKSTELATDRLYDPSQAVFIDLDNTSVAVSSTNLTFNGKGVATDDSSLKMENGTVTSPSYSFTNSVNAGMFISNTDTLGFATAGVNRLSISNSGITSTLPILNFAGTAALPTKTFDGDTDTGLYNPAANTIGLTTGGVNRMIIDSLGLTTTVPLMVPDGTASSPALTFNNDLNSGIYSGGTNSVNIATGSVNRVNVSSSGLEATVPIIVPTGDLSNPSIKFTGVNNTGIYRSGTSEISIATGGAQKLTAGRFDNTSHVTFLNTNGSASTPAYSFTADENVGMYSPGAGALGFTVNSGNRLLIDSNVNVLTDNLRHSGLALELNGSNAYRIGGTAANNAEVRWNAGKTDLTLGSTVINNILVSPTEISMQTQTGGTTFLMDNAGNMLYPNFNAGTLQTSSIGLISTSNNTKSVFKLNSSTANLVYSDTHIDLNWDSTNRQLMFSLNTLPTGTQYTDISNLFQTGTTIASVSDDISTSILGVDMYFSTNGVRSATFDHVGFGATSTLHLTTEAVQVDYPSYKITVQTGGASRNLTIVVNKYFN